MFSYPTRITPAMAVRGDEYSFSLSSEGKKKKSGSRFNRQIGKERSRLQWFPSRHNDGLLSTDQKRMLAFAAFDSPKGHQVEVGPVVLLQVGLTLLQKRDNDKSNPPSKRSWAPLQGRSQYYRAKATLRTAPQTIRESPNASVIMVRYTRQQFHQDDQTKKVILGVQWTRPRKELPQPIAILQEESM